jgi:hypothetical protein
MRTRTVGSVDTVSLMVAMGGHEWHVLSDVGELVIEIVKNGFIGLGSPLECCCGI